MSRIYINFIKTLSDYFLSNYRDRDFVSRQKAKTLLVILLTLICFISPVFIISNIIHYLGFVELITPPLAFISYAIILIFFKRGHHVFASHALLIITFIILWSLFFLADPASDYLVRMDTISLILGLHTLIPLILTKHDRSIVLYFLANTLLLFIFIAHLHTTTSISSSVLIEYFLDNFIAIAFIGVTSYLILSINHHALERARTAEQEMLAQNEELRASNEEFEAINEELIASQDELIARENALELSEERYRNIIESIEEGYFEVDLKGNFTFVNSSMAKRTGFSVDELVGSSHRQYLSSEKADKMISVFKRIFKTGNSEKITEYDILKKDGSPQIIELSVSLIHDENGEPIGFRGLSSDVTKKKRQEEEALKIKKIESIGILAGGIAHDFNNILTAILGNISLAMSKLNQNDSNYEILSIAEKASMRARDLTQQLLTFSKGGAPIKKLTTIKKILEDTTVFALSGSSVGARFEIPDDLYNVELDSSQISQVIHNLIINSQQAMPEGGVIVVKAANIAVTDHNHLPLQPGNYIHVSITDSGSGISKKDLLNIFDPYFTTKENGTGLGLTVSYSIIKSHGGYITADSEIGKGTTFHIYLPASDMEYEESSFEEKSKSETKRKGRGTILLMDDDDMVSQISGRMLNHLGYTVHFASNGHEMLHQYKKEFKSGNPYDLVIMDLTVPGGMGGKEAISLLREFDKNVRAVVSSGYSNDPVMAHYRDYGFCGIIVKPYRIDELEKVINEVL